MILMQGKARHTPHTRHYPPPPPPTPTPSNSYPEGCPRPRPRRLRGGRRRAGYVVAGRRRGACPGRPPGYRRPTPGPEWHPEAPVPLATYIHTGS